MLSSKHICSRIFMGLDMNLYKETYVKNSEYMGEDSKVDIEIKGSEKRIGRIKTERICDIVEEVFYWRKANAIHQWFVDNCGGGVDECQRIRVGEDDLKKLLFICETIIEKCPLIDGEVKNGENFNQETGKFEPIMKKGKVMTNIDIAKKLLPTQEGFFFGGTDYDEYYMDDIIKTRDMLKEELKDEEDWYSGYYYQASW